MSDNNTHKYFNHNTCEFYPCHKVNDVEGFNCLFCYCPLYRYKDCGGQYKIYENVKDCSECLLPHKIENYEYIIEKLKLLK